MFIIVYERLIGKDWMGFLGKEYILYRKVKGGMFYDVCM